jgi:hypothetical protein
VAVTLLLTNFSSGKVAYKMKTTSPQKYCVRPSLAFIEPGGSLEVQVIMQEQNVAPLSYADCKDKFLVQYFRVSNFENNLRLSPEMFYMGKAQNLTQVKLMVDVLLETTSPAPAPQPPPQLTPRAENLMISFTELTLENQPFGQGSFGKVYKAFYHETPVAVKVLNEDFGPAGTVQIRDAVVKSLHKVRQKEISI